MGELDISKQDSKLVLKEHEKDYFKHPEKYSYSYFRENTLNLNKNSIAEALSIADEELLTYYDFKFNSESRFFPRMDPYEKDNYFNLDNFLIQNLNHIIGERIKNTNDEKKLNDIILFKKEFFLFTMLFSDRQIRYLFKKIASIEGINPSIFDEIYSRFPYSSSYFAIDLYSILDYNKKLDEFFDELLLPDSYLKEMAKKPHLHLNLWVHQIMALESWLNNGKNGILEMATASGKTVIGIAAIDYLFKANEKLDVLILVHSHAILNQWRREIIDKLGMLADNYDDFRYSLTYKNKLTIRFNTLQTVYKNPSQYPTDLLIVDEVHHSAGMKYREALNAPCNWKMGLSATIDGKSERRNVLKKYIGDTSFKFTLTDARQKGIIPEFKLFIHKTYLDVEEEQEFNDLSSKLKDSLNYINYNFRNKIREISEDKFSQFENISDLINLVEKCKYKGINVPQEWVKIKGLLFKRRSIIHKSSPKRDKAIDLAKDLGKSKKCVMFAMKIDSCEEIHDILSEYEDLNVFIVHSELDKRRKDKDYESELRNFRNSKTGILVAPRILDEGIDIPDADVGINVASSKTELQLVQRMGRILRKSPGKEPEFHHFVALPNVFVESEDSFNYLNDLTWIYDITAKMGINAKMYDSEEDLTNVDNLFEKYVSDYNFRYDGITGKDFGIVKIRNIVQSIPEEPKQNLIELLDNVDGYLSDESWLELLRKAHNNEKMVDLPNHRWLLILTGRDPAKLKQIISSY